MKVSSAVLGACLAGHAYASKYHRQADTLVRSVNGLQGKGTTGFAAYIQLAKPEVIVSSLEKYAQKSLTIVVPNNALWDVELSRLGVNTTEVDSLMTSQWSEWFTETFQYLFFDTNLNTSAVADGQTVLLNSIKKSPAGDWPLQIAFRRDQSFAVESDALVNGTFYAGQIKTPNMGAKPGVVAHVVGGKDFLYEPQSLSATLASLGVTSWPDLVAKVPLAAELENSRDYTLLLPANFDAAFASFKGIPQSFLETHLVSYRVVLGPSPQPFETVGGLTGSVSREHITSATVTVPLVQRDVLTNGIMVQVIEKALV
ncbi:hypothetical protein OIV83_005802 [Microbotryomycetes sp. JL201]|nr:hypothetical protein OIV83_005802 [Microbotryomycetes sp. JL201]